MSSNDRIYGVLMASGFSRRFGGNKLLAPFRGKPLARHTLDLVCGLDCFTRIFFVAAEDPVLALAGGGSERLILIRNEHPGRGQRESIRLGLAAVSAEGGGPETEYYMFFPCDQPLLDAATVRRIAAARSPGRIIQPCFRGEPGNPVLFSGFFRDALRGLAPGERGRDLIRRHPERLIRLEIASPGFPFSDSPLADVDDPQTLSRLAGPGRGR